MTDDATKSIREPTLLEAAVPILFLVVALAFNVAVFGDEGLDGSNQLVLMISSAVAVVVACGRLGLPWSTALEGMVRGIGAAMPSVLILMLIGALAGTWLLGGIVPAMVYYGLQILHPSIFLFASILICAVVSLATGSSWSTIATVGLALIGIGETLGMSPALVAGAIISGAYFGDKLSPLSDTTNLAPAVAGTDIVTHIRYMLYTTVPSFTIAALLFLIIGLGNRSDLDPREVEAVLFAIESAFNISPWLFAAPLLVVVLIILKAPALPALFAGALAGAVAALIAQPEIMTELGGGAGLKARYAVVMRAMYEGVEIPSDNPVVAQLLSSGGVRGMLNTIWLILVALAFGGVMEISGMLRRVTTSVIERAKSEFGLFGSAVSSCLFFNLTTADQYLAIVVPGRMYAEAFEDADLAPENLSRTLEDAATVTGVLIPWNTCGAAQSTVLGVATLSYLPFCFFNLLSPVMTLMVAGVGFRIRRRSKG